MFRERRVLAVVPARSGSKGIPDKNLACVGGESLFARCGRVLSRLPWIDARLISTDSERYADEGRSSGLDAFFLRPPALSHDHASAADTVAHALREAERHYAVTFDIILIIEPTSPLRQAEDVQSATRLLVEARADSVVTVSRVSTQHHPMKLLKIVDGRLRFFLEDGAGVTHRQSLRGDFWVRNGICYAVTRECVISTKIFTEDTYPCVIDRAVANIDEPIDLRWAEFLLAAGETESGT